MFFKNVEGETKERLRFYWTGDYYLTTRFNRVFTVSKLDVQDLTYISLIKDHLATFDAEVLQTSEGTMVNSRSLDFRLL